MEQRKFAKSRSFVPYVFILILPFVVFHWMVPFVSDISLGNDYPRYHIQEQMELLFSLRTGTYPLYVPGYCSGQSASALTLGQLHHPISHAASLLPGYWNGQALEWNTCLRLISLGVVHLGLFALLLQLKTGPVCALILSFVTVYNLRMLDLFRYGASLESWTGHLMLCAVIGLFCIRRHGVLFYILMSFCAYWLVTSGHPQMMYYGLLGSLLFTIMIPHFVKAILPGRYRTGKEIFGFYLRVVCCVSIGILLSSAYTLPFYFDFLSTNSGRFDQDYAWTLAFGDSFIGTVNNFFYPLRSDVHGAFGGSPLLLAAVLLPFISRCKAKVPSVIWGIWAVIFLVFVYMQGGRTGLHYLAWKTMPFLSSVRIAERISMVLPILFMLLLTWGIGGQAFRIRFFNKDIRLMPVAAACLGAVVLTGLYGSASHLAEVQPSAYSALSIRHIPTPLENGIQAIGALTLISWGLYLTLRRFRILTGSVMAFLSIFYTGILLYHGTWVEGKTATPPFSQIAEQKKRKLDYRGLPGIGLSSANVMKHVALTSLEPSLGKFYKVWIAAENNAEAYEILRTVRKPNQVVLELTQPVPRTEDRVQTALTDHVDLIYSSFNRMVFDVNTSQAGFFVLGYPYSSHWRARVNERPVSVIRANGLYQAVYAKKGLNRIEFRYESKAVFWGMLISCITLALCGAGIGWTAVRKPIGLTGGLLTMAIAATGFAAWHNSLYNGRNLGTEYSWTSAAEKSAWSLAYGKQSRLPQISLRIGRELFYSTPFYNLSSSGKAVDGETALSSGFITQPQRAPWYLMDMHQTISTGGVAVYEGKTGPGVNTRPLTILFSDDLKHWRSVGNLRRSEPQERPVMIRFSSPERFRYMLITASGFCRLALDEVEVYPYTGMGYGEDMSD